MLLAEKARDGHIVARLKWGDPFVFDSGAKEALFLHEQGVPFEVVPGVPAAIGATAYAGIPLTYPGAGDALVLLRGHEDEAGRVPDVDWEALARIDGTIVCYAGGRLVPTLLQKLLDHGVAPDAAAALIYRRHAADAAHAHRQPSASCSTRRRPTTPSETALLVVGEVVEPARTPALVRRASALRPADRRHAIAGTGARAGRRARESRRAGDRGADVPARRRPRIPKPSIARRRRSTTTSGSCSSRRTPSRGFSRRCRAARATCARSAGVRICAIGPSTADRLAASGIKAGRRRARVRRRKHRRRDRVARLDRRRSACSSSGRITCATSSATTSTRRGAAVTDLVAYRTAAGVAGLTGRAGSLPHAARRPDRRRDVHEPDRGDALRAR